jgi:hypothetical protein
MSGSRTVCAILAFIPQPQIITNRQADQAPKLILWATQARIVCWLTARRSATSFKVSSFIGNHLSVALVLAFFRRLKPHDVEISSRDCESESLS